MTGSGSNVVTLATDRNATVNADAIELIEGTLERLKSGEVVAVAVVEVLREAGVANHYSQSDRYFELMAGVARLQARLAVD